MAAWREDMAALQDPDRDPIQPQYLIGVVDRLAGDDAIPTCGSGTIATWAARHWTIRGQRQFYLSGNLASMAPGLPYAMAAQLAFPGRQCIAFIGDGGLAMLMVELDTAARYELSITVVVNNNASLGQIESEQVALGYPEYGVRFDHTIDFARVAGACGAGERSTPVPRRERRRLNAPGRCENEIMACLRFAGTCRASTGSARPVVASHRGIRTRPSWRHSWTCSPTARRGLRLSEATGPAGGAAPATRRALGDQMPAMQMKKLRFGLLVVVAACAILAAGLASLASASSKVVGHVYVNDNTVGVNTIGAFDRHADGTLTPTPGSPFAAGGAGTGTGLASQGSLQPSGDGRHLLAVDAGSNQVSVLRIRRDGSLKPVGGGPVSSNGVNPVSIAVHGRLVYVANAGTATSAGGTNYSGFELNAGGHLRRSARPSRSRTPPSRAMCCSALMAASSSAHGWRPR